MKLILSNVFSVALLGALYSFAGHAIAAVEPTIIEVRVLSKGANFIGDGVGGAAIRIEDADTGALLAEGVTTGGSGDTDRIMKQPRLRGEPIECSSGAVFRTKIELTQPRRLRAIAKGPMQHHVAANVVSSTQLVLPGRHLTANDGWLMEMPGLIVEVVRADKQDSIFEVVGRVRMMCGCSVTPGGLWNAEKFDVTAVVRSADGKEMTAPMKYAGQPSHFSAQFKNMPSLTAGSVSVIAFDLQNNNAGMATRQLDRKMSKKENVVRVDPTGETRSVSASF